LNGQDVQHSWREEECIKDFDAKARRKETTSKTWT
jgi:hypothetical protein